MTAPHCNTVSRQGQDRWSSQSVKGMLTRCCSPVMPPEVMAMMAPDIGTDCATDCGGRWSMREAMAGPQSNCDAYDKKPSPGVMR